MDNSVVLSVFFSDLHIRSIQLIYTHRLASEQSVSLYVDVKKLTCNSLIPGQRRPVTGELIAQLKI